VERNFFFFIYHFCWLSYLSKLAECWGSFAFIGFLQTFKVMHVGLRIFDNLRIISTFRVRLGEPWIQGIGTGSSSPYPLRGHGVCCFFLQHYIRSSQGTVDWMSRDLLPLLLYFIFLSLIKPLPLAAFHHLCKSCDTVSGVFRYMGQWCCCSILHNKGHGWLL